MTNALRFSAVLIAFAASVSGVVWATVSSERRASAQHASERAAAHELVDAFAAREAALRGFVSSSNPSFLEPFEHATASLGEALDEARDGVDGDDEEELDALHRQAVAAERWAGIANETIVRVRNGRELAPDLAAIQTDLSTRFNSANAELLSSIDAESAEAYRRSIELAVLLIALLSVGFGGLAAGLLHRHRRREQRRQAAESAYYAAQREFTETLQVTESEPEAHSLVKRHLERTLTGAEIVVLSRNNSQNRLEPATPLAPGDPLGEKLVDSSPSSCLAVRLGRTHTQSADAEPLLTCTLCSSYAQTTCVPSLVGGAVIGSVLVAHPQRLTETERSCVDESVSQSAPVLANLRNLAVAEVRAATDALTGLPNARALRDNLVRMVAQASRSSLPLAAILCDLDHFKQINDIYGHDKGDEALAAASTALRSSLRESDLAGRYGGEEFLLLLPDTTLSGAMVLAEKVRDEVARVLVPGVDRAITASFGVAAFPEDAPDGEMLVRMADRALYAAKARGRNCVVASAQLLAEPVTV